MDDQAAVRNFRDFLTVYNSFTEKCFNHCVSNLNYRALTPEEELCVDRCSSKLVNVNHRIIGTYMEVNPMNKLIAEQQAKEAENANKPATEGASQGSAEAVQPVSGAGTESVGTGNAVEFANVQTQDSNTEKRSDVNDNQR
ncbi:mitochondrial import inner membrane translocase subunit Tim10 B-like [Ptychodera flava]|uniref:mitochondrial import inner membrane translocase subunit Tim10 B-like n=1 Tax=Ptychodera flava TaxID=63121 RepID=UPI003969F504